MSPPPPPSNPSSNPDPRHLAPAPERQPPPPSNPPQPQIPRTATAAQPLPRTPRRPAFTIHTDPPTLFPTPMPVATSTSISTQAATSISTQAATSISPAAIPAPSPASTHCDTPPDIDIARSTADIARDTAAARATMAEIRELARRMGACGLGLAAASEGDGDEAVSGAERGAGEREMETGWGAMGKSALKAGESGERGTNIPGPVPVPVPVPVPTLGQTGTGTGVRASSSVGAAASVSVSPRKHVGAGAGGRGRGRGRGERDREVASSQAPSTSRPENDDEEAQPSGTRNPAPSKHDLTDLVELLAQRPPWVSKPEHFRRRDEFDDKSTLASSSSGRQGSPGSAVGMGAARNGRNGEATAVAGSTAGSMSPATGVDERLWMAKAILATGTGTPPTTRRAMERDMRRMGEKYRHTLGSGLRAGSGYGPGSGSGSPSHAGQGRVTGTGSASSPMRGVKGRGVEGGLMGLGGGTRRPSGFDDTRRRTASATLTDEDRDSEGFGRMLEMLGGEGREASKRCLLEGGVRTEKQTRRTAAAEELLRQVLTPRRTMHVGAGHRSETTKKGHGEKQSKQIPQEPLTHMWRSLAKSQGDGESGVTIDGRTTPPQMKTFRTSLFDSPPQHRNNTTSTSFRRYRRSSSPELKLVAGMWMKKVYPPWRGDIPVNSPLAKPYWVPVSPPRTTDAKTATGITEKSEEKKEDIPSPQSWKFRQAFGHERTERSMKKPVEPGEKRLEDQRRDPSYGPSSLRRAVNGISPTPPGHVHEAVLDLCEMAREYAEEKRMGRSLRIPFDGNRTIYPWDRDRSSGLEPVGRLKTETTMKVTDSLSIARTVEGWNSSASAMRAAIIDGDVEKQAPLPHSAVDRHDAKDNKDGNNRDTHTTEKSDKQPTTPPGSPPRWVIDTFTPQLNTKAKLKSTPKPTACSTPTRHYPKSVTKTPTPLTPAPRPRPRHQRRQDPPATPFTPSRAVLSSLDSAIDEHLREYAARGVELTPGGQRVSELLERRWGEDWRRRGLAGQGVVGGTAGGVSSTDGESSGTPTAVRRGGMDGTRGVDDAAETEVIRVGVRVAVEEEKGGGELHGSERREGRTEAVEKSGEVAKGGEEDALADDMEEVDELLIREEEGDMSDEPHGLEDKENWIPTE